MKRLLIFPLILIIGLANAQDKCSNISLHGIQGSAFGVYKSAVEYKVIQMEGIYSKSLDLYLSYYPIIEEGELYINFDLAGISQFDLQNKVKLTTENGLTADLKLSQFIIDGNSTNKFKAKGKRVSLRAKINKNDLAKLAGHRITSIEFANKQFDVLNMWGEDLMAIAACIQKLAQKTDAEFNYYKAYEHLKRPESERMFEQTANGYIAANGKTNQKERQHGIGIVY
ncbi:MAG: hypothetical protein HKN22_05050 [Bacteroidia bacterium]|nr:hypothetical protein [Bacteroidia bacterium]